MTDLADRHCVPCRGGVAPLEHAEVERLRRRLDGWEAPGDHHLARKFRTRDYAGAWALVNRFSEIAEAEGHHPVLRFSWGWVEVEIWTHKINGLTESDFVLAARFDRAARAAGQSSSSSGSGGSGSGSTPAT